MKKDFVLWHAQWLPQQIKILDPTIKAVSALGSATSGVTQTSTQVGFEVDDANNSTEWVLVLVAAIEAMLAVLALAVTSCFKICLWRNAGRQAVPVPDKVATVGWACFALALASLGLVPVFIARDVESDAARMALNDVYAYQSDTSTCFAAVWGDVLPLGSSWCSATRVISVSMLVRSYSETFFDRYNTLATVAVSVCGVSLILCGGFSIWSVLNNQAVAGPRPAILPAPESSVSGPGSAVSDPGSAVSDPGSAVSSPEPAVVVAGPGPAVADP